MRKLKPLLSGKIVLMLIFAMGCHSSIAAILPPADTVLTAGSHYDRGWLHTLFWGKHYRKVWAQPVKAPFLDLQEEAGGLKPLQKGGSFQTKNLRMENPAGKEYVLRSIDKDPTAALPVRLRNNFIGNLMKDQTSVIHPYGAFIIPPLAEAAGILHTKPRLAVVPNDPVLGEFREEFANMLVLIEERPDGNQKNAPNLGNSKDVQSSRKMFRSLVTKPESYVEAREFLRARLFDMWVGDWSRREDQWRWASYQNASGITSYRPIPRDRDHAFFKFNDGLMTRLITVVKPNYQTFGPKIKNLKALNQAGAPLDRSILNYLTRQDFLEEAQYLKTQLTDQVIADALHLWPENIYALTGKEFDNKLRSRRDQLPAVAEKFYELLAADVDLPGTDKPEIFRVTALPAKQVKVERLSPGKKGQPDSLLQSRTFNASETKKISLYGLDGDDKFEVLGDNPMPIEINLYDGAGEDKIIDHRSKPTGKKVKLFDSDFGTEITKSKGLKIQKKYEPKAKDFSGEGWLLRHRLH